MPEPRIAVQITATDDATTVLKRVQDEVGRTSSAVGSSLGPMQRFGKALTLTEGREGGLLLREIRSSITQLGAEALGTTGPLGRLAATVAQFSIGGVIGLAAVGGVAAIAVEIQKLASYADRLDQRLQKVNVQFAQMVPQAGKLAAFAVTQQRLEELQHPGFAARAFSPEFILPQPALNLLSKLGSGQGLLGLIGSVTGAGGLSGISDLAAAATSARSSEEATEENIAYQQMLQIRRAHTDEVKKEADAVGMSRIALERARLGHHATEAQLDRLAHQEDVLRLSTSHLSDATQKQILANDDAARSATRLAEHISQTLANMGVTETTHPLYQSLGEQIAFAMQSDQRVISLNRGAPSISGPDVFTRMAAGIPKGLDWLHGDLQDIGKKASDGGDKLVERLAGSLPALFAAVQGHGGVGGAISGLGGVASSLAGVKGLAALGPVGAVLGGFGQLVSLFSSGGAKVSVLDFNERALQQMKQLAGVPNSATIYIVNPAGGNARDVQWAIQHAGRKDVVTRLPQP